MYSDLLFFILNGGDLELQLKAMQGLGQYKCVCVCVRVCVCAGVGVWGVCGCWRLSLVAAVIVSLHEKNI